MLYYIEIFHTKYKVKDNNEKATEMDRMRKKL